MSQTVFDALDAYLATPEGKQAAETMRVYHEVKEVYDATIEAMYPKPQIITSAGTTWGKPAGEGER